MLESSKRPASRLRKKWAVWSVLVAFALPAIPVGAADRIPIHGEINGQPVTLILDTGASASCLYRSAAERLGLKTVKLDSAEPILPGQVSYDLSEECTWTSGKLAQKVRFPVIDNPAGALVDADGVYGWPSFSNLVFQLDTELRVFDLRYDLPSDMEGWSKWRLVPNSPRVLFDCPKSNEAVRICLDTGSDHAVWLNPKRWREWRSEHAGQPSTLEAASLPADGIVLFETWRAKTIDVGGITLRDVAVSKSAPSASILCEDCDAVLGLYVFTQLRVVVDGKSGWVYTKPVADPSWAGKYYPYNRIGAVFVPRNVERGDDLVAHVIKDSPAYRAGIRDGDVLFKIGVRKVTNWRTDPTILPLSRFWSQPAGTKHRLTLKRGDEVYEAVVTLEDLPAVE